MKIDKKVININPITLSFWFSGRFKKAFSNITDTAVKSKTVKIKSIIGDKRLKLTKATSKVKNNIISNSMSTLNFLLVSTFMTN